MIGRLLFESPSMENPHRRDPKSRQCLFLGVGQVPRMSAGRELPETPQLLKIESVLNHAIVICSQKAQEGTLAIGQWRLSQKKIRSMKWPLHLTEGKGSLG